MNLISLELENFRQHSNTKILFNDGITVVIGSNGSGKSTVLEAITWAIYGTDAARGNKDSIKWNKAPARSKVKVELVFNLESETFKVLRWLDKAELYLNNNTSPIVTSQQEVTKYLIDKIGMNKDEFFNTYFTGQKELDFLGNQKPIERRKFISKVLNYEKARMAQENVRLDKNNLSSEIIGLEQGLENTENLEKEKNEHSENLAISQSNLESKKQMLDKKTIELGKIYPDWMKIKTIKDEFNKKSTELKFMQDKLLDINKSLESYKNELEQLDVKDKRLKEIEFYLDEYKKIEAEILKQEKLQKFEIDRQKLQTNIEGLEKEILEITKKTDALVVSLSENTDICTNISLLQAEIKDLKANIDAEWTEWTFKKQEIKALIKQKEVELGKIASQQSLIEQKGKEGTCPTCERPLKDEYEKVINQFQSNIKDISQEIQSLVIKEENLSKTPESIEISKKLADEKEKNLNEFSKIQGQIEQETKLLESLKIEVSKKTEHKSQLVFELEKIPSGFDRLLYEKLKEEFSALKRVYDEILALKAQLLNKDKVNERFLSFNKEKDSCLLRINELETSLKDLQYSQNDYDNLEKSVIETEKACNDIKLSIVQNEAEINQLKLLIQKLEEVEKSHKDKISLIKDKQKKLLHLMELDRFYGILWEKLNNQARPEISELASKFLEELTDGRYSTLEINEKYDICLYDDGEIKPVISGGEEDIANLCVRLAISQMIAQRSGKSLSLLVLDEVFGSLDENRRNNVVSLLHKLTNSFDQIILITHIDELKENLENVIKVEYDEEKSCSIVICNNNQKLESLILD